MNNESLTPAPNTTSGMTMSGLIIALLGVLLAAVAAVGVYLWQQKTIDTRDTTISSLNAQLTQAHSDVIKSQTVGSYNSTHGVHVVVYAPVRNGQVSNPLGVIGKVPGSWSFEAAFPVELQDSTGATIARGSAHVLGDWTTSNLVPFSVSLVYSDAPKGTGTLILHKDNESGLAKNNDEVRIPVRF